MFNVVIPLPKFHNYGSAIHALKFVKYMQQEKIDVRIINLVRIGSIINSRWALPIDFLISLIYLLLFIRKKDFSYFHLSDKKFGIFRDTVYLYIANLKGSKVIVHFHSGHFPEINSLPLIFRIVVKLRPSDQIKIITLGDYVSGSMKNYFEQLSKKVVIKKILNDGAYIKNEKNILTSESKELKILFVSQLYEQKGIKVYLDVARLLQHVTAPKLKFLIAGRDVERILQKDGTPPNAQYLGSRTHDEIIQLMSESSILIFPSTYKTEAQPLTILEAMSQALAIIATKYRSIPEMVCDGYNGYLIDPKSQNMADDIVEVITKYIQNTDQ